MTLSIDFGGTSFRYCYDDGEVLRSRSNQTDLKAFLDQELSQNKKIDFIGISYAGQVENGKILSAPNIKSELFDVKGYVKSAYGVRLEIDNDLKCAAIAEYAQRPEAKMLALFYVGTGFGSCFMQEGKIIRGAHNIGGEIGHIPFRKTPFTCGCGRDDCLELSVSGSGLERWRNHFVINIGYNNMFQELRELKSQEARIVIQNFYDGLEHAFHTVLNLFDPDTLVLGGGVMKHNEAFVPFLRETYKKSTFLKQRGAMSIELSKLREGSLEGAKLLKEYVDGNS